MLAIAGTAKILLCQVPIDLRKGFEGLSSLVESLFDHDLTSGAYFVFLNRQRNRIKVLYWDNDGLAIWNKRLEKGSFPKRKDKKIILERREFFMLLEGITPHKIQKRFRIT
jgi:transposase